MCFGGSKDTKLWPVSSPKELTRDECCCGQEIDSYIMRQFVSRSSLGKTDWKFCQGSEKGEGTTEG